MKNKKTPASKEQSGISKPKTTNKIVAANIKKNRVQQVSTTKFISNILEGNISYLSRAITLVESTRLKHQQQANQIIEACLPYANKAIRIGITGVPGVGKSTFIEAFGKYLTSINKKVAVLAIDPSSRINKGSILGDKTRMESLVTDKNAFIRPSPAGSSLGGVAQKTRESILLCEAAGFDVIIVETVGVGQSETAVDAMVDFFLLLKLAGAGDQLQGIKRGIIEMADAIVINKADGGNKQNANLAKVDFNRALHLYPPKESGWQPKVLTASALHNEGIEEIYTLITTYLNKVTSNGYFQKKRNQQNKYWLLTTIEQQLKNNFFGKKTVQNALKKELNDIQNGKTTPFNAAERLLNL